MKICLITDEHFGVHGDSQEFLEYQEKFYSTIFFPYLKENGITEIISLGDEFDSRKAINYNTLNESKNMLFNRIEHEGFNLKLIIGNHNVYHKEHNDVNSPNLLFEKYKNIQIIEKPEEIQYDSCKFLLIPWINKNNQDSLLSAINKTDAEYLLGHFEIVGMALHKNWQFHKGLDNKLIDKFKEVWSGHYHIKLKKNNFSYLGTPYQMDWNDINHKKGFYIFDTQTKKLTFIENPLRIYHVIDYKDSIDVDNFDYNKFSKSYIRIYLNESIKSYDKFDLFVKKLEDVCYHLKTIENFMEVVNDKEADEGDDTETTIDTIKKKCDEIDIVDKDKLFKFMNNIFIKSKDMLSI